MSNLAHSHQPTMREIDRKRAIESGDEDLIRECAMCPNPLPEGSTSQYCDICAGCIALRSEIMTAAGFKAD